MPKKVIEETAAAATIERADGSTATITLKSGPDVYGITTFTVILSDGDTFEVQTPHGIDDVIDSL